MNKLVLTVGLASLVAMTGCASTQEIAAPPASTPPAENAYADALKTAEAIDGLFTIYRDTTDGSLQMIIRPEQLEKEFIYFTQVADGVPVGGHFRGQFRDNSVFSIRRRFNQVEFVELNTAFYFDEQNALSRSAAANISPAVLVVEEIVAEDDSTGNLIIKADGLFRTEALARIKPPSVPGRPPTAFSLGNLSRDKTAVLDINSYPENTDVLVRYVYDHPSPLNGGGPAVTDARSVSVTLQHSFIEMPENDYVPLLDDARVGYFTDQVTDLTSTSPTPYRDLVNRWNLVKADPSAEISDPVDPIVWWIENTTPLEYRDVIRDATLRWNEAFETAGFSNAIEVRVQPDDADWDAGDIRYNVLRWTSSPTPPFGGYGPSFTNPRTGQIVGADVMLEYVFLKNRIAVDEIFESSALFFGEENEELGSDPEFCTLGLRLQAEMLFGQTALQAAGASETEVATLVEHGLYYLILHEVGHTLGLNHNMKATQMLSPEETTDWDLTIERGLQGSVMDYPALNLAAPGERQGAYATTRPGPYDHWAIEFAYGVMSDSERSTLLERSTEPDLVFGNDADDMRSPGKAIDPRVMIGDMSSDAIAYAEGRMDLVDEVFDDLLERYDPQGQSYEQLRNAYLILTGQIASGANTVSRYVGGVYVDRAVVGQDGATQPFTPVGRETQERAMDLLTERVFAPDAFDAPNELYSHLARQRRGFNFFSATEDPKIHDRVLNIQQNVLAHLLHPVTMKRITDSRLYGNEYDLTQMMSALTSAIFDADARGDVNTFRQNLQLAFVTRLVTVVENENNRFDFVAQSQALARLREVQGLLSNKRSGNAETQAHTAHVLFAIETGLDLD